MSKELSIDGHVICIDNGDVFYKGEKVGRLEHDLKHGYHPIIRLTLGTHVKDWEVDHWSFARTALHIHNVLSQRCDSPKRAIPL